MRRETQAINFLHSLPAGQGGAIAEPPSYGHRFHEAAPLTWLQCPRGNLPKSGKDRLPFLVSGCTAISYWPSSLYFPSTRIAGRTTWDFKFSFFTSTC